MKRITASTILLLCSLAAFAVSPLAAAPGRSAQFAATIYGHLDLNVGAWVGHAIVTFDKEPPKMATIIDASTDFGVPPGQATKDGMWYGKELMTLSFVDGSGSFEFASKYYATPAGAPGLYTLHETSTIGNGTGDYVGISGTASIEGPFVGASIAVEYNIFVDENAPLLWIASVRGQVSGLADE